MARTPIWPMVCIALVALDLAVPAQAKPVAAGLHISLPAPGHITVAAHTLKVAGERRRAPKLVPQKLRALPPSVRVIYARRVIHKRRSTTFAMALIAVNVAAPAAESAGGGDEAPPKLLSGAKGRQLTEAETVLLFMGGPVALPALFEDDRRTEAAEERAMEATRAEALADAAAKARMLAMVTSVVDPNADGNVESGLDTGHYDDGHAFGWGIKSKADEKTVWRALVRERFEQWANQLEDSSHVDLDGDGTIESASPGSGGQQIDTQVGGPVVTGGGP